MLEGGDRGLEEEPLTKGGGDGLNLLVAFEHPDIEEFATLFQHLLLQFLCDLSQLKALTKIDQIHEALEIADVAEGGKVLQRFLRELDCVVLALAHVLQNIFDDLLHENLVVALSRRAGVRTEHGGASKIQLEVSSAAASFAREA